MENKKMENNQNNYLRLFCGKQRNGKQT